MQEIEQLKELLNRQILLELYGPKWKELYRRELVRCISDIEAKMRSDSVKPKAKKNVLDSFLQDTKLLIIENPLDTEMRNMIRQLLTLLYNWNKAFSDEKELEIDILLAIRLIDQTLTLAEYLSVSRELLRRLRDLSHFSPPTFELSRHYLQTLLDKYNEE
ncbi:MAG: hypothetical protein DRG33_00095 [Deltaproteobacteria bacterium]|nr:MAG: hypothetical protein DRG33_00095 [Deltaproteobacteria bacterium]